LAVRTSFAILHHKSQGKIAKIVAANWPEALATGLSQQQLSELAGVDCGAGGISYPLGGWLCPAQLTAVLIAQAQRQGLTVHYQHQVSELRQQHDGWQLHFSNQPTQHHATLVLANGADINLFSQTEMLPVYAVGGQVSHIPTNEALSPLKQVLCYDGYMTPVNPANQHHCIGASYRRGERNTDYREDEQQQNRQRLIDCLPNIDWPAQVDVSGQQARCGVRCATRDHLPMIGSAPDYHQLLADYQNLPQALLKQQDIALAASYSNLYLMGALGSRGLSSAPLSAEVLAAQISGEPIPLDSETLAAINPNRMWVRKLLKGRPVTNE